MSDSGTRAVMEGYLQALRDRADFDRFFTPDVSWTTMETGEQIHGRQAVRDFIVAFHTQVFDAAPQLVGVVTGNGAAVLEAVSSAGTSEPSSISRPRAGTWTWRTASPTTSPTGRSRRCAPTCRWRR